MNNNNKMNYKKLNTYSQQEEEQINILMSILKIDCTYSITRKTDDINNITITFFHKGSLYIQLKYNNELNKCKIILFNNISQDEKYVNECKNLDSVKNGCNNIFNIILTFNKTQKKGKLQHYDNEQYH